MPDTFGGIYKMIAEGGATVLLAFIVYVLAKKLPVVGQQLADAHAAAIKSVTDSNKELMASFAAEAKEARSMFRTEQDQARTYYASLLTQERAACDQRTMRMETKLDAHGTCIEELVEKVTELRLTANVPKPE